MQNFTVTSKDPWLQIETGGFTLLFWERDFTPADAIWLTRSLFAGNIGLSPSPDPPEYGTRDGYLIGTVDDQKVWIGTKWNGGNAVRFTLPRRMGEALRTTDQGKISGFMESRLSLSEPILPKPLLSPGLFPDTADGEVVLEGTVGYAFALMYDFEDTVYFTVRGGPHDGEIFLLDRTQCSKLVSKKAQVIKTGNDLKVIYVG
jgi:hypothetical protein